MKKLFFPEDNDRIEKVIKSRKFTVDDKIYSTVSEIVKQVKLNGDRALREYTARYDGIKLQQFAVDEEEINRAYIEIDKKFLPALKKAIINISDYQSRLLPENSFYYRGKNLLGQLTNPLQRIAVYIPGGRAAYPSSVLMTVIPAQEAGVKEIVAVSPPGKDGKINPYTLVALNEAGITEIYKVGGAQSIAALAWGTESIASVEKIVGPGNIYVTLAKKMVYGQVDIDMLAGPSEILILADETAPVEYVAADLLSQAEHDPLAVPALITSSRELINNINNEVDRQLRNLPGSNIARESWQKNGLLIYITDLKKGIELVNKFAPEHLELMINDPTSYLGLIRNAGAIFLGRYSPEPLGDYIAGPSHVLPTGGTARFASALSVHDFIKRTSIINYNQEGLASEQREIRKLAELEGLPAHAEAVRIRFTHKNDS